MDNTEELSMMLKGIDFDAQDLIIVASALGEIKKKKKRKKERRKNFRDDAESILADTSGGSKQLKTKKLNGAKGI